jgi:hypothetical protein
MRVIGTWEIGSRCSRSTGCLKQPNYSLKTTQDSDTTVQYCKLCKPHSNQSTLPASLARARPRAFSHLASSRTRSPTHRLSTNADLSSDRRSHVATNGLSRRRRSSRRSTRTRGSSSGLRPKPLFQNAGYRSEPRVRNAVDSTADERGARLQQWQAVGLAGTERRTESLIQQRVAHLGPVDKLPSFAHLDVSTVVCSRAGGEIASRPPHEFKVVLCVQAGDSCWCWSPTLFTSRDSVIVRHDWSEWIVSRWDDCGGSACGCCCCCKI